MKTVRLAGLISPIGEKSPPPVTGMKEGDPVGIAPATHGSRYGSPCSLCR
jgi:hypothetical protein